MKQQRNLNSINPLTVGTPCVIPFLDIISLFPITNNLAGTQ